MRPDLLRTESVKEDAVALEYSPSSGDFKGDFSHSSSSSAISRSLSLSLLVLKHWCGNGVSVTRTRRFHARVYAHTKRCMKKKRKTTHIFTNGSLHSQTPHQIRGHQKLLVPWRVRSFVPYIVWWRLHAAFVMILGVKDLCTCVLRMGMLRRTLAGGTVQAIERVSTRLKKMQYLERELPVYYNFNIRPIYSKA